MRCTRLNRLTAVIGISAVACLGTAATGWGLTPGQGQSRQQQEQHDRQKANKEQQQANRERQKADKNQRQAQRRAEQDQERQVQAQARQGEQQRAQAFQNEQRQARTQARAQQEESRRAQSQPQRQTPARLPAEAQQGLVRQQQLRITQFEDQLIQSEASLQQRAVQLQTQHRTAQYSLQIEYGTRLRAQQASVRNHGDYNYGNDPYFFTAATYRYRRDGRDFETNEYGIDVLRQAVRAGYQEGVLTGRADRQDRWASNYQASLAFEDATLGYRGFYVDQDDYRAYFREGFRRGYEDGYYGRYRYGRYQNGRGTILGQTLALIVRIEAIR